MVSVIVRSAKEISWFLKNSVADLVERIVMVFIEPILNHTTSPYLGLRPVRVRCGIVPRSNMLPNIGHPGGPGGRWLLRLGLILRWSKRIRASKKKMKQTRETKENSMTSRM